MSPVYFLKIILIILISNQVGVNCEENSQADDPFVPTQEWQVVKKGQKIPKGCHVRINFETGITEAKILEENKKSDESNAVVRVTENSDCQYSRVDLKEALKNIKNDDTNKEHVESTNFKSYKELKKDLKEINLNPKTDVEIITELMTNYKQLLKSNSKESWLLQILEDLEYLVHQIDNANDFITMKGFEDILYPNLNSSNVKIKDATLKLLGSCLQHNVRGQIHALETGAVGMLLKVLVLNNEYKIKNRAIFALSSLMRQFPHSQLIFVDSAGLNIFLGLLESSRDIKLQLRIVTLIYDLILEHDNALSDLNNSNYNEKVQQYDQINLRSRLHQYNWCKHLILLLENIASVDINDHDSIEKSLSAILALKTCTVENIGNANDILIGLQMQYKQLVTSVQPDEDNYFEYLLTLCNRVFKLINYKPNSEL
ncbi:hypothetical protein FQA39_LY04596 [Lamprigera yunnana]|nr:hypothetical protein FQA39_LY04596 [Lamprigera yunnana]